MKYCVLHELPDRIRLRLSVPSHPAVDRTQVEAHLHDLEGVRKVAFNPRTRTLLVRHNGRAETRESVLRRIAAAPIPGRRRPAETSEFEAKKRTVLRSGTLLLARPLIPPPVRPFITFAGALPIFRKGGSALVRGRVNVDLLDSAAIGAAMAQRDFFTASIISFLLKLGDFLEEWTKKRSRKLLSEMFHVEEEWAWVLRGGEEVRIDAAEIEPGDRVVVRAGGLIPVDGVALEGEAMVNQSSLTGESLPVAKRPGISVYAGTALAEGRLVIEAREVGTQTRAARVVKVIEEAEAVKALTQSRSEQLADRVVPYSFLLSGLTLLATDNPARAASVLLVDYSCAIKLSTPLAILSSLARAARHRVVIKGGKYLEKLAEADAFVLDKTGTLTVAAPRVAEVVAFNGFDRDYILRQAACVEEHFPHPVATAVVRKAAEEGLSHREEHAEVEYVVAHGIVSKVHGMRILVGSRHFVHEDEKIDLSAAEPLIDRFAEQGHSVLYVAMDRELAGLIAIHDPLRHDARQFVRQLREQGIGKVVMLTGDNPATARTIAAQLGIDDFVAQAFPEKKVEIIKQLQSEGYTVAMVGDGINDSPALSHADVGISMRHGADIAREACDVLLMEGELTNLLQAREIAGEGLELIRENFRNIIAVNSVAMFMGMTGSAPPLFSAALHNLTTIAVGLKALKPLRKASGQPLSTQRRLAASSSHGGLTAEEGDRGRKDRGSVVVISEDSQLLSLSDEEIIQAAAGMTAVTR